MSHLSQRWLVLGAEFSAQMLLNYHKNIIETQQYRQQFVSLIIWLFLDNIVLILLLTCRWYYCAKYMEYMQ